MLKSIAAARRLSAAARVLGACCILFVQAQAAQAPQGPPNPQDRTVKMSGAPVQADESGRPLDVQKSAPIQVVPREYDIAGMAREPKVPETVFRGRVLWLQKCAYCHDGLGQPTYKTMGPWVDQEMVKTLTEDVVKILIRSGTTRMPAFKDGLSEPQLDDLVNFLKSVPASAAPTPAQLAGRSEGGNSD